jgi:hypothetical protein
MESKVDVKINSEMENDLNEHVHALTAAIASVETIADWKALYKTQLWKIKPEYTVAMMDRFGIILALEPRPGRQTRETLLMGRLRYQTEKEIADLRSELTTLKQCLTQSARQKRGFDRMDGYGFD